MRILILGHGKMGTEVAIEAKKQGLYISDIYTSSHNLKECNDADVCIDFSSPKAILEHLPILAKNKTPIISGTTGLGDKLEKLERYAKENNTGVVYSPNFSIGLSIFSNIASIAAELTHKTLSYDVSCIEMHHSHKKDAPSGTALLLVDIISAKIGQPVKCTSVRCGHIKGSHEIIFDSECDSISIHHTVKDRSGFANGAIKSAKWILDKKGFFMFKDICLSL